MSTRGLNIQNSLRGLVKQMSETAVQDNPDGDDTTTVKRGLGIQNSLRGLVKTMSEHAVQKEVAEADRLYQLGKMEGARGRHHHALKYFNEALVLQRKNIGDDHPDTSRTLNDIGVTLIHIGEEFAALTALEEALYIRQTVLGPGHEDAAESLSNLTLLLRKVKEKEEAAEAARNRRDEEGEDEAQELPRRGLEKQKSKSWVAGSKSRLSAKIEVVIDEGRRRSTMLLNGMKKEQLDALKKLDQEMDEEEKKEKQSIPRPQKRSSSPM